MKITGIEPLVCQGGIKNWTFVKVTTDEGITGWGVELNEEEIAKHRYE